MLLCTQMVSPPPYTSKHRLKATTWGSNNHSTHTSFVSIFYTLLFSFNILLDLLPTPFTHQINERHIGKQQTYTLYSTAIHHKVKCIVGTQLHAQDNCPNHNIDLSPVCWQYTYILHKKHPPKSYIRKVLYLNMKYTGRMSSIDWRKSPKQLNCKYARRNLTHAQKRHSNELRKFSFDFI